MAEPFHSRDLVRVAECVGSRLNGLLVRIVAGPSRVGSLTGVYRVRHEESRTEELIHGSRLCALTLADLVEKDG